MRERCETAARLVSEHDGSSVLWCHLNPEGDLLEKLIPETLQVSGTMPDELKEERLIAFQTGELKRLIIKPKIGAYGLNWQHCHNIVTFPSHSFEQYYQSVRRCWRFGQKHSVTVTVIATEGEMGILKNLQRKSEQADKLFSSLVEHVSEAMAIDRSWKFDKVQEVPQWL